MKLVKKSIVFAATASVLLFTACSGSSDSTTTTDEATVEAVEEDDFDEDDFDEASADNSVLEITIKGDDMMKFDLSTIRASAGQTVKLTLEHVGKLPVASMGHNWVLLNNGVDPNAFATKAIAAKDNDYIPTDAGDDVIVHTDMIGGGESTTIEFTAPERGAYDYICSFPGHSGTMKGKLMVQ